MTQGFYVLLCLITGSFKPKKLCILSILTQCFRLFRGSTLFLFSFYSSLLLTRLALTFLILPQFFNSNSRTNSSKFNTLLTSFCHRDTPRVHLHHRQAAVVHSEDLPALAPQSRLRGRSLPVCFSPIFHSASISAGFCQLF